MADPVYAQNAQLLLDKLLQHRADPSIVYQELTPLDKVSVAASATVLTLGLQAVGYGYSLAVTSLLKYKAEHSPHG